MSYEVYETNAISELFDGLETDEKDWIVRMRVQIKENAFVGKPLRFVWFREKKYKDKRLYYLIYEDKRRVLLVAFGDKKDQQEIINSVLANRERYRKIIESI